MKKLTLRNVLFTLLIPSILIGVCGTKPTPQLEPRKIPATETSKIVATTTASPSFTPIPFNGSWEEFAPAFLVNEISIRRFTAKSARLKSPLALG